MGSSNSEAIELMNKKDLIWEGKSFLPKSNVENLLGKLIKRLLDIRRDNDALTMIITKGV